MSSWQVALLSGNLLEKKIEKSIAGAFSSKPLKRSLLASTCLLNRNKNNTLRIPKMLVLRCGFNVSIPNSSSSFWDPREKEKNSKQKFFFSGFHCSCSHGKSVGYWWMELFSTSISRCCYSGSESATNFNALPSKMFVFIFAVKTHFMCSKMFLFHAKQYKSWAFEWIRDTRNKIRVKGKRTGCKRALNCKSVIMVLFKWM